MELTPCPRLPARLANSRAARQLPRALATTIAPAHARALPDPAFAAIAAHRAAYARLDAACTHMSHMERAVPNERREEWFDEDRANGLGANDDPRWTAALDGYRAASDAEKQKAWAVARCRPVSLEGAAALLRYGAEYEDIGCDWPSLPETEDGEEEWMITFHQSLAAALEGMV